MQVERCGGKATVAMEMPVRMVSDGCPTVLLALARAWKEFTITRGLVGVRSLWKGALRAVLNRYLWKGVGQENTPGEARLEHLWKGVSQATHLLWFKGGWSNPWQGMSQAPGSAGPRGDGSPPVVASKILLTCAMIWRGWSQS